MYEYAVDPPSYEAATHDSITLDSHNMPLAVAPEQAPLHTPPPVAETWEDFTVQEVHRLLRTDPQRLDLGRSSARRRASSGTVSASQVVVAAATGTPEETVEVPDAGEERELSL